MSDANAQSAARSPTAAIAKLRASRAAQVTLGGRALGRAHHSQHVADE